MLGSGYTIFPSCTQNYFCFQCLCHSANCAGFIGDKTTSTKSKEKTKSSTKSKASGKMKEQILFEKQVLINLDVSIRLYTR